MTADFEKFFNEHLAPCGFPPLFSNPFLQRLAWRRMALAAWRKGVIPLPALVRYLLPARFKKAEDIGAVQAFVDRQADEIFKAQGLYNAGSLALFGRRFAPVDPSSFGGWQMAFRLYAQIVRDDQYHTRQFIRADSVVIDGGANVGMFAILAARAAPRGRIYAFEPASATYGALVRNLSGYENARTVHGALGNRNGETELLLHDSLDVANTLADSGAEETEQKGQFPNKERVRVMTIDAFVAAEKLPRVDFIKLDTEGYEKQILEGARATIAKWKPTMVLSAYHRPGDRTAIETIIRSIEPSYTIRLEHGAEDDLVCEA